MLTFDPEKHRYAWNGETVPGVSEILRETGQVKDWSEVPAYYRDRGAAAHACISLYLRGTLDEDSVDPIVRPYLDQFKEWDKAQPLYTPITEQPFYSEIHQFAGTPDLICNGVIYDIKCSKKLDKSSTWQYRLQGAAYRTLALENIKQMFMFKILLLSGEGKAVEIPLDAPTLAWEYTMGLYDLKTGRVNLLC